MLRTGRSMAAGVFAFVSETMRCCLVPMLVEPVRGFKFRFVSQSLQKRNGNIVRLATLHLIRRTGVIAGLIRAIIGGGAFCLHVGG